MDVIPTIKIILPCKNEEVALKKFLPRLISECAQINCKFEVLIIDDGSEDGTISYLEQIDLTEKPSINISWISLERNVGKVHAQNIGRNAALGDSDIVLMDGDGQHPIKYLNDVIQQGLKINVPLVGIRQRYKRKLKGVIGTFLLQCITKVLGIKYVSSESEYIFINQQNLRKIQNDPMCDLLPINDLIHRNFPEYETFPFDVDERILGDDQKNESKSRHELSSLLRKAALIIFADPWQVLARITLILCLLSAALMTYGLYIGIHELHLKNHNGVSSLLIIFLLLFVITWIVLIATLTVMIALTEELRQGRKTAKPSIATRSSQ